MRNEDNDCIRYLMKEMDPSEELLMERAMMEDEDLLIEVESMRQTLAKLDKLPQKNPPSELTDSILEQASEQAKQNRDSQKTFGPAVVKYAAAATIALTLTAGGAWLFMGSSGSSSSASAVSNKSVQAEISGQMPTFDIDEIAAFATLPDEDKDIDPWVDRDNVLRFDEEILNNRSKFNALIKSSTQKLQLIDSPSIRSKRPKSIQLTGTGNQ